RLLWDLRENACSHTSFPRIGKSPWEIGLSWFGDVTTFSLPPSKTSQPHPDPNCLAVVSLNNFLKSAKLPKSFLIWSPILPVGSPPPPGFMIIQNIEWFTWPPPL